MEARFQHLEYASGSSRARESGGEAVNASPFQQSIYETLRRPVDGLVAPPFPCAGHWRAGAGTRLSRRGGEDG